ncbi:GNAT family N-acetyltransferase [Shewanella sp. SNU WT4]|uniref:GNAT family N-acetyltransferase n=1 Tax=Shewanella sp. SNU WT4 TaxID=2590015 RepID=UPI0011261744|nr:GNAT family N-acetyltransferase [Shewanella sp. SNU WT4]QDF65328.1 GNAT family N-acetyltransferase [Shewanella sp. SNU WT4]
MKVEKLENYVPKLTEVATWHFTEWHDLYPGSTLADFVNDLHNCLNDDAVPSTWVLVDGDEVVGSASILTQDMTTHPELSPWLANVFIKPEYRGKRLGSILINEVMRIAADKGLDLLHLFTEDQREFYEKLGWQAIKQERYQHAEVTIMAINLNERRAQVA